MADVDSSQGGGRGKKGGPKTKKKSTKIDMTAMVDVAFLLLTFFVLTATMSNNGVMELTMPPKAKDDIQEEDLRVDILEDKIMTIVLEEDDKVSYYVGITNPEVLTTNYSQDGIRKVLVGHLTFGPRINGQPRCETGKGARVVKNCWDPIFVIKPKKSSRYKNLVDLLDELAITEAPKYAIDKFTVEDSLLLIGELEAVEEE
ncbi:MAG: biopolymer transporter ExbD [Bacteroidota bacterium]